MKEFIKHNPATLDNVETMANAMIESMRFVDNTLASAKASAIRVFFIFKKERRVHWPAALSKGC